MKGLVRALAIALLFVGCGGDGCRLEQEALIIDHSLPLGVGDGDAACEADPNGDEFKSRGTYDVAGETGYVLAPLLVNNLVAQGTEGSNSNVEPSELRLESTVDIDVHLPSDVADRLPSDVPLSYGVSVATDSIGPGDVYVPLLRLLSNELIEALPSAVLEDERVEMTVDIVFHATRTGNSRGNLGVIDSRLYTFPIELCNGCMRLTCECNAADECEPDTSIFATLCGRTQDITTTGPSFACDGPFVGGSSGSSGGAGSSSDSGGSSGF